MEEFNSKTNKEILTIPNILTVIRICFVPIIMFFYMMEWYVAALVFVIISFLTDAADGYIARKYNQITALGKMIDPLADKMTQVAVLMCLLTRFGNMAYLLILMLVKEISGFFLGIFTAKVKGVVKGAVWHGKLATGCLTATFFIHFVWVDIPANVSNILIIICGSILFLSMILYLVRYIGILRGTVGNDSDNAMRADREIADDETGNK